MSCSHPPSAARASLASFGVFVTSAWLFGAREDSRQSMVWGGGVPWSLCSSAFASGCSWTGLPVLSWEFGAMSTSYHLQDPKPMPPQLHFGASP